VASPWCAAAFCGWGTGSRGGSDTNGPDGYLGSKSYTANAWKSGGSALEAAAPASGGFLGSGGAEQPKLRQGGDPVVQADLLDDLAVLELEDGDAGEVHLPARVRGQAAGEEVLEGRAGVGAAAFPLADDVVALGEELGRAPELQVGERDAEIHHEGLDVFAAFPRLVQRIFQQHVRRGNLVDHVQVE